MNNYFTDANVNWNVWSPQRMIFKSGTLSKKLMPKENLLSYSSKGDRNLKMAKKILINAKLRNTSICGATETLLIHKNKSKNVNEILNELTKRGCSIYADRKISKLFNGNSKLANNKTWSIVFLCDDC